MKITDLRATTVTVPLEAPLRHANGCHWGRFVRTIVEVETDEGLIGLGEMGGGGESAEMAFRAMRSYLIGHDPARLEELRFLIANPTASLYNNRTQTLAALEFACLDILGQKWGVPISEILGGRLRERVPFASYLFFRYPNPTSGAGEVRTAEQLVANALALKQRYGFTSHKLKGGVFPPEYELECYRAVAKALAGDRFRFDPNGVWSTETAIWFGQQIEDIRNDYLEDPVYGMAGMRRVREKVRMPLATNTVVVNFEQLAANVLDTAVDVILLDTTFWGGIRPCIKAAGVCETFQIGVAVHSSGELGIQLATMLHLGAVIPNLSFAADAHYHHLAGDIIEGGKFSYEGGSIAVPQGPGLGVKLDYDKLAEYSEQYQRLGSYPYDQDPLRLGWTPTIPNDRWADPLDERRPTNIPCLARGGEVKTMTMTNEKSGQRGAVLDHQQLKSVVTEIVASTPVIDVHTHLMAPQFGEMSLFGIDELLTYHYLIAETLRSSSITPEQFWLLSKSQQADLVWQTLFVENTPLSEATRGVVTVLNAFDLDTCAPDLTEARAFFRSRNLGEHVDVVLDLARVSDVVMTNDPFSAPEVRVWETCAGIDSRFHSALRMDRLVNDWPHAMARLSQMGYRVDQSRGVQTASEVRRFLDKWIAGMAPVCMAVSLPAEFRFPQEAAGDWVLREIVLPAAREHGLPLALMIGVRRAVNPRLGPAGDGVGRADVASLERMCAENPDVRFLATFLARENQHELCVAARKFSNLMPFGCWWFLNNPSIISEITRERLELLGTSFIPQHSDARILEQLIYKWQHSRRIIAEALLETYERLLQSGRAVTRQEVERDVTRMFSGNFREWSGGLPARLASKKPEPEETDVVTSY